MDEVVRIYINIYIYVYSHIYIYIDTERDHLGPLLSLRMDEVVRMRCGLPEGVPA